MRPIRVLTPRDRKVLLSIMEIVAEEVARGQGRPGILYRIKDEMVDLWGVDVHEMVNAMESGWNKGKRWT